MEGVRGGGATTEGATVGLRHAFGVETPKADVSTCGECDGGFGVRLAALRGCGHRLYMRGFRAMGKGVMGVVMFW